MAKTISRKDNEFNEEQEIITSTTGKNISQWGIEARRAIELMFDESERGKKVYFCLRWESTHGEKGSWSEIVMAIIS